ncbi:MAG: S-layer homology domain-containing protein [Lachnospiraceae bacterium]|nr:S-layer homology domain-containing protein [Lachnospiraceae bacterium]
MKNKVLKTFLIASLTAAVAATATLPAIPGNLFTENIQTVEAAENYTIANNGMNGVNIDISGSPYTDFAAIPVWGSYAYSGEGCAWFASARVRELTGLGSTIYDGNSWYNWVYAQFGFTRGTEPKAGSLACYTNHIAVVEKVDGDTLTISEGGRSDVPANAGHCSIFEVSREEVESSRAGDFLGYVYFGSSCKVTAASISVNGNSAVAAGSSTQMSAVVAPEETSDKSVTWSTSNPSVTSIDENGILTGVSQGTAVIQATAKDGSQVFGSKTIQVLFNDVADPSSNYYDAVYWAVNKGITSGISSTSFGPGNNCTRGQIITFLYRALGNGENAPDAGFADNNPGDYWYQAVNWAAAHGIAAGTGANTFSPNRNCTRGEIITFLYRAAGGGSKNAACNFSDVKNGSYCYDAVNWAVANGITNGTAPGAFGTDNFCTRSQAVVFLSRIIN